jgi:CHAT domain-containing protein/tetratricopeptide (TPR) repeat protein
MMVTRQKVVVQILLVWLVWHCHASGALALDRKEQTAARASELLTLSKKQNFKDHSLALETAKEALELWRGLGDNFGIAQALGQVARCYFAQSDLVEAAIIYKEALELWRRQNDLPKQTDTLNMLGFVESEKGDWESAISYYTQAQALINDDSDPVLKAQIAAGLGSLFNDNGIPEKALIHYQRALELYKQTENLRGSYRMMIYIGQTYLLLGDYAAAQTHLQDALTSATDLDAAQCQEYLGQLKIATGEYDAALQYLQPALASYDEAKNPKHAARVRALIGQAYEQQGAFGPARTSYLKASDTFRRISDRVSDAAVSFALGRLELKGGNYDAAEEFLKQSLENTERIRSTATGRDLTEAFSASVHARYAAYIECLMRKHKLQPSRGLDVLAFQASELARARSLAELLHETQTNLLTNVDPETAAREKALRQSIRVKEDQKIELLGTAYNRRDLAGVEASLAQLREEYKQILEKIHVQNPSYEQISRPTTYSLQQIQLDVIENDRTVLLEYFLGTDASYVWLVTSDSFTAHELPKDAIITEAVKNLYELLSAKPNSESDAKVRSAAHELGQMILAPVAHQLAGRRVIVVADGALNYVPFQVLSSGHRLLIEDSEIINAPSASILGQLRQELSKRKPAEKILAAFGDAVFPSNYAERKKSDASQQLATRQNDNRLWRTASRDIGVAGDSLKPEQIQQLFYAGLELKNIRELAGPGSFLATGFDATREKLESTDLSQYSILHLATHGVLDPKRPEQSGFLLSLIDRDGHSQDGFITMKDVYRLQVPVDLVVLSACRTGLGKEVLGEGLIGLTRGFMHAGASSVASTLWRVDDEATAELMKYFYANMLQHNMTPAAALRDAQNTIRQDPRWSSPHYWAAFTLQGEYQQKIKRPTTSTVALVQRIVIAGLLLTFLAGVAWWFWRRNSVPLR